MNVRPESQAAPARTLRWLHSPAAAELAVQLACIAVWCLLAWFATPGLVYAKLQADAAVYMAQARHLWEHGTASGMVLGDGLSPIVYAPLQAYVRAPLFGLSTSPEVIVRLIQIQNIGITAMLGWVSSRYIETRLPAEASKRWLLFPWLTLTLTYIPWTLNLVLPLGDHLYALLTMGALLSVSGSRNSDGELPRARLASIGILVALAAIQKFTSLALLPALFVSQVFRNGRSRPLAVPIGLAILFAIGGAAWLGRELFMSYIRLAVQNYLSQMSALEIALDSLTNLLAAAIPSQIIPNFSYFFHRDFAATHALLFHDLAGANFAAAAAGFALSVLVAIGAWQRRREMRTELVLALLVVPVYAVISNSTARYLGSIQPVFVVWFAIGLATCRRCLPGRRWATSKLRGVAIWTTACALVLVAGPNLMRSFTARSESSLVESYQFFLSLSEHFDRGRVQMAALTAQSPSSLLLYQIDDIRWYGIAGNTYVSAPRAVPRLCSGRVVYAVFACDIRNCGRLSRQLVLERTQPSLASLIFVPVYHDGGAWGEFSIDRVRVENPQACSPGNQDARSIERH